MTGDDLHEPSHRQKAEAEREFYERHGRPSRPFYLKCLACGHMSEVDGALLTADHDARYHAGYHGGWKEENAEIVVTDSTGRELFRHHAIHRPDEEPEGCPNCDEPREDDRIACSECGYIPEEHRLGASDGGEIA